MSYIKRLDRAFENAPILPITSHTKYVFFSDCHRGVGDNNDNFLKNQNSYYAALQHYYQNNFCYIEVGDGDELWENRRLSRIVEIHDDAFSLLSRFHMAGRLYMLYGNHDITKKASDLPIPNIQLYEGIILKSKLLPSDLYVTHGHQADFFSSVLWRLARFLVRYLWTPLEYFSFHDPTSAAKNNRKKNKIENKLIDYAKNTDCLLLTGHTHRPTLGNEHSPYYNCGSCVHPKCITCIELCGYEINLVKWLVSAKKDEHLCNLHSQCPPEYPLYIKREIIASESLIT